MSDSPRRNAWWLQPIGKAASKRPVHSSWIPCGGGQITSTSHFLPSAPHGDTCSKPMIMLPGTRPTPAADSALPRALGSFHYENDNGAIVEGQRRRCSVKSATWESHLHWSMTTLKSVPSEVEKNTDWFTSQRSAGNAKLVEFIWMFWHAPPTHLNTGSWPHGNVTPQHSHTGCVLHQPRDGSGELLESNIIKVVFGHKGTQRSPVTARNIRPNTLAPVHGPVHGCVPSRFHYAPSQLYHAIVAKLLSVFWCPFKSASLRHISLHFEIRTE